MKVLILGGGPAGLNAAVRARQLGATVTLIERHRVGGTSLNEGPAPVRTLARAARLLRDTQSWPAFGLKGKAPELDLSAALAHAKQVADYAHGHKRLNEHVRSLGVELIESAGNAHFTDPHTVATPDGRSWSGDKIVIAVGGHAGRLAIPGAELALTYIDVRTLTALPRRIAIIGGADTGCQLASILADFGCQVLILEHSERLISRADEALSMALSAAFKKRGIEIVTGAGAQRLSRSGSEIEIHFQQSAQFARRAADAVFFAVGWPANLAELNLAAAGVSVQGNFIAVDEQLRTQVAHIYAVGDVNGRSMLVPSARHEGRIAAENAVLGTQKSVSHQVVATGSFTDPEYGSVGLTEAQARAQHDCEVAFVSYDELPRAVIDGRTDGFCKLIVDRGSHRILGAHVLGEYSAEVIQVAAVGMTAGVRVEALAETQLAFPTFTEALGLAALRAARALGLKSADERDERVP